MRKHTARHWLHAVLDLLPVLLIPVFMIYSHRHTIDSGSIDIPVNKVVDFNQKIKNGNFINSNNWQPILNNAIEVNVNNNVLTATITNDTYDYWQYSVYQTLEDIVINNIYYLKLDISSNDFTNYRCELGGSNATSLTLTNSEVLINVSQTYSNDFLLYPIGNYDVNTVFSISNVNLFNLTQMFGSGNEPTIEQFNQWYSKDYYDYTLSRKELLKGYSTQTYNDTDIMSQFTYQLYNSVDKYFNMGNVFGMSNVYDWFNLNIFGGNAPISIYIVWNIVLYEFVMDLLFLLYALFMWFIDMTKRLIEKPLDSIK